MKNETTGTPPAECVNPTVEERLANQEERLRRLEMMSNESAERWPSTPPLEA